MARVVDLSDDTGLLPWERFSWLALPSWVISLALHATFLGVLAFTMQPPHSLGVRAEPDRVVGIYTKVAHDVLPEAAATDAAKPEEASSSQPQEADSAPQSDDSAPEKLLDLPPAISQRVGPGPAFPVPAKVAPQQVIRPALPTRPDASPAGGPPGIPFFDADATGKRFVYVLDSSGSMSNHNAIGVAKTELLASLQQLDPAQEFQIIFYNEHSYPMVRLGGARRSLFAATDLNRNQARQFIRSIQPDGGTNHLEALMRALEIQPQPDVIFFLTDAESGLSAADLERVKRKNGGKTQIHTVEFGVGANLSKVRSFLKKLSDQNGGTFSYRDVTKFDRD